MLFYQDVHVLVCNEHLIVTPDTHKHADAAGSLCLVITETGAQQGVIILSIAAIRQFRQHTSLTIKPETCWYVAWQFV